MTSAVAAIAPLLPDGRLELKYLFGARLLGGQEVFQTPDDVSLVMPGKSAFYDLMERDAEGNTIKGSNDALLPRTDIELFQLEGQGCRYLVDLTDGHFEVTAGGRRAAPFFISVPPAGSKLRLIYFRRRRQHIAFTGQVQDDGTVLATNATGAGQECEYHVGWRTEDGSTQASLILV